jgi:hypothetical protein
VTATTLTGADADAQFWPSEPIGYGRPHGDGELVAAVHPADLPFLS